MAARVPPGAAALAKAARPVQLWARAAARAKFLTRNGKAAGPGPGDFLDGGRRWGNACGGRLLPVAAYCGCGASRPGPSSRPRGPSCQRSLR
jgi:hypothetical protein